MSAQTHEIRNLNDDLRRHLSRNSGLVVMTPGVAGLGSDAVARIARTIALYDDFCHDNDPHEEHDFGSFEVCGHMIFFKIDYYDNALTGLSSDPADPSVTRRVLTIMLAEDY